MELKVWVEGVARVVCGLSMTTSCQDVVIALAQAIGQTGRYVLLLKLRGTERHLVADDCPLQHLAQLGQEAAEVRFVLRRTGPSLSSTQDAPFQKRHLLLPRPMEEESTRTRGPHKSLTFSLGPSSLPRRAPADRNWSPSPRGSPEPRASPVYLLDPVNPSGLTGSSAPKEEVFRLILQQQKRLQLLEVQLQDLERDTQDWEQEKRSLGPELEGLKELEELEERLQHNQEELLQQEQWEQQLQEEQIMEREMLRRIHQLHSSLEYHEFQMKELRARSAHLQHEMLLRAHGQEEQEQEEQEALRPLKKELQLRLLQGQQLETTLSQTQRQLRAAERRLQDRLQEDEELQKELRQWKLQQFIQRTTASPAAE